MVLSSLRAADPYLLSNCYCSNTDWAEHINLFPFHPHICCAVCFFPLCPPIIAYQDVLVHIIGCVHTCVICFMLHRRAGSIMHPHSDSDGTEGSIGRKEWSGFQCLQMRTSRLGLGSVGTTTSMARTHAALPAPLWFHYPFKDSVPCFQSCPEPLLISGRASRAVRSAPPSSSAYLL